MNRPDESVPEKLVIRAMTAPDVDPVTLLEQQIFPDPWPRIAFEGDLGYEDRGFIVAEYNGIICGYAGYITIAGEAHLTNIAVALEYRGKSIAKTLLNRILEIARKADCDYIFLDVRPSNEAAISLYKKYNFRELYRRPDYYRFPVEDALVMVKNLRGE
ncbi:MAG: ribosomal protein S18-alanine N-acetyltransferase [Candidatus Zixiibacteriota bacterium]|nr:MAG: ribosomal protein S18-alanine N-acetyltransferase [candidate division Zixibacteria bacterium]